MFAKNIRVIYLYLVCFVALMMIVGGIISTVNATINYVLPYRYEYYDYTMFTNSKLEIIKDKTLSQSEKDNLIAQIDQQQDSQLELNEKQESKNVENNSFNNFKSIITSCAFWVIATPLFIYHWKKIQIERVTEK